MRNKIVLKFILLLSVVSLIFFGVISMFQMGEGTTDRSSLSNSTNCFNETVYIIKENPYGENPRQDKSLFSTPVQSDLTPVSELRLCNGEMESFRVLFPAETGSSVKSISSGMVVKVQNKRPPEMSDEELQLSMLGKYIIVDVGNGISIRYAHLSDVMVEEGTFVSCGDEIGIVGYSGVALPQSKQSICGIYILEDGLQVNPLKYLQMPNQFVINVCQ